MTKKESIEEKNLLKDGTDINTENSDTIKKEYKNDISEDDLKYYNWTF